MSRGFIIATLLISTAALGICRPGRQYPKKPPCGSVTTMENIKIKNVNVKGNINFGSVTVTDGKIPCEGVNYVRHVDYTYNGENVLPNEKTSGWQIHEIFSIPNKSSETEQNSLDRVEKKEFFNEGTLHNFPQNILDAVQKDLESVDDPMDKSHNGIEVEKVTHSDQLGSSSNQTSLVTDKLYIYLLTLIMVFQCKLF
ncbi:hypothetical protein B5X24_HaOG211149 [Helicoverpa armigera]|uniref:Uncharacterized protein n=1 Tax=Helicoverpa armigera TaxID=29058 RepID=A0A2W1BFK2_HELAM|nr:hypothetical protein B5X24_HaOG211149 [Helicoverpa armigera]